MPWRPFFARSAAAWIIGLALPSGSSAAEPWLDVEGSARCSPPPAELAVAIRSRVAGEPHAGLQVKVTLSDAARASAASPTRARIELKLGAEPLGVKSLAAATCSEAIDGVVAVVALALSTGVLAPQAAPPAASTPAQEVAPAADNAALDEPGSVPLARPAVLEAAAADAPQLAAGGANVSRCSAWPPIAEL